ncbi:hypothetical protein [Nonomuraea aurantiaca]
MDSGYDPDHPDLKGGHSGTELHHRPRHTRRERPRHPCRLERGEPR